MEAITHPICGFTQAARTLEAHKACLNVSKALAGVGARILIDEDFVRKVQGLGKRNV